MELQDLSSLSPDSKLFQFSVRQVEVKDLNADQRARRDILHDQAKREGGSDEHQRKLRVIINYEASSGGNREIVERILCISLGNADLNGKERNEDQLDDNASNGLVDSVMESLLDGNDGGIGFRRFIRGGNENFLVLLGSSPQIDRNRVVFVTFKEEVDFGMDSLIRFLVIVISPTRLQKQTKSCEEVGRSWASLLHSSSLRHDVLNANSEEEFFRIVEEHLNQRDVEGGLLVEEGDKQVRFSRKILGGVRGDLSRRLPLWVSDWKDGLCNKRAIMKSTSTVFFLYFACLLPAIAFGQLNSSDTNGELNISKTIIAQGVAGFLFACFAGQPLVILLSTAPLAIYIKIVHDICEVNNLPFLSMYAWVGLWNGFFLIIYGLSEASYLMKYVTAFTGEVFSFFIGIAFIVDAAKPLAKVLDSKFYGCSGSECDQGQALSYLILLAGVAIVGIILNSFRWAKVLKLSIREFISDYSLPISVLLMTLVRHFILFPAKLDPFEEGKMSLQMANLSSLPVGFIFVSAALGFALSILFFVDMNVSALLTDAPGNKLKKGQSYHWDLILVAILNIFLSVLGLPWVHGALPHSPLHAKALAEIEKISIEGGHTVERVIRVQETRVSAAVSHALLAISFLMLPTPLHFLPVPVLYGVFWFLGYQALADNSVWARVKLYFTEQSHYPPTHYLRQNKQKNVHIFTLIQLFFVGVFCLVSFYPNPYLVAVFPIVIVLLIPVRMFILPKIFGKREVDKLDH